MSKPYRKGAMMLMAFAMLICPVYLFAQAPDVEAKIKSVPPVTYPAEASKTGLDGEVRVVVDIDTKGKITKAYDATGPGWVCDNNARADVVAMRQIAAKAAKRAVFAPAMSGGKPVASQTRLTFFFINPHPKKEVGSVPARVATGTASEQTGEPARDSGVTRLGIIGGIASSPSDVPKDTGAATDGGRIIIPEGSTASSDTKTLSGGVLNGKAVALARPAYPAAARAIKASGSVQVQVVIDTNGTVLTAEPKSGHPLLRASARHAACDSSFAPTLLSGEPVLVAGIITYNFTFEVR